MTVFINTFMWGAFAMGCMIAGLYFMRLYRDTRDRLFSIFGLAFFVLAIDRAALVLLTPSDENRHYVFLVRLVAFLLIIAGVIDKNRRGKTPQP